jgi:FkbM family methyltransferase
MSTTAKDQSTDVHDLPFRHYSLKHRALAWVSMHLFDWPVYTVHHGLLRGMKRRGGLGWLPVAPPVTAEHQFWEQLDLDGATVYDIGAFHGLLTLYFARKAQQVISYEPTSRNRKRLEENLALNRCKNVRVRPVGLGSAPGLHQMSVDPLMPGGAAIVLGEETGAESVNVTTLDSDIEQGGLPTPSFMKLDTEGWELEVLRGARQTILMHHPDLFIEMHGNTMNEKWRKAAEIVEYLTEMGYGKITHVESGTAITPANSRVAAEGHLYCQTRG